MKPHYSLPCAALFLIGWLWASSAEAHSIYVFAYQDASQICTNSYFGGKAKVRGGTVSMIAAATGEVLATAITDEKGDACFAKPEANDLLFRVEASGGHQGEFKLSASDVGAEATPTPVAEETREAAQAEQGGAVATPCSAGIGRDDLDKAVAPILLKLAEMESEQNSGFKLKDIIGGLGWLIGLAGAALWVDGRKKKA